MRWESVALRLARAAGIRVPDSTLRIIDGKPVLIVDRFDRAADLRIGYVSAMTMLDAGDGDQGSYLEIAEVIDLHSPRTTDDLRELWRRVAFSILISNTDDPIPVDSGGSRVLRRGRPRRYRQDNDPEALPR